MKYISGLWSLKTYLKVCVRTLCLCVLVNFNFASNVLKKKRRRRKKEVSVMK